MATINKFNLVNPIPQHRLVEIFKNGTKTSIIKNVPLIIDDEVGFKVSSKYGEIWQGSSNSLLTLLSSTIGTPSGQFALQGMQIWNSTDPLKISFKVHVEMDTDALNDVIQPVRTLMCVVLPHYADGITIEADDSELTKKSKEAMISGNAWIEKHFNLKLKTLIPPGPNLQTILSAMSTNKDSNNINIPNTYDIKVGWAKFRNMIITSVDPTFSKDVCYIGDNPYPISAEISIEASSIEIATTNMIEGLLV